MTATIGINLNFRSKINVTVSETKSAANDILDAEATMSHKQDKNTTTKLSLENMFLTKIMAANTIGTATTKKLARS